MLSLGQLQTLHNDIRAHAEFDAIAMTPDGDDAITQYYNTLAEAEAGPILIADVLIWAAQQDRYNKLAAGITAPGGVGSVCQVALIILSNAQVPNLDLGNPTIASMLETLVNGEILTAQDQADLFTLAITPISRAQVLLGVPRLTYAEVGQARALP